MYIHKSQAEQKLINIINNQHTKQNARIGLIFNLAGLEEQHKNEEHFNIALNVLRDKLSTCVGDIVSFGDGDIFVICNNTNLQQIEEAIFQMRYLFVDDQLAYLSPGIANNNFCQMYDLQSDWSDFFARCEDKIIQAQNDNFAFNLSTEIESDIANLLTGCLENSLAEIDMESYTDNSPIWMHSDDDSFKMVIREIEISKNQIRNDLIHTLDFLNNPHLFKYLCDIVDIKLLIRLINEAQGEEGIGCLINISLSTLQSEEFELFDSAIAEVFKKNIIIAFNISEVLENIDEFMDIKNNLQNCGYKVCLNDIDYKIFLLIEAEIFGFDLIKLKFDKILIDQEQEKVLNLLYKKIESLNSTHLILTNCDTEAFALGKELGIYLFKGKFSEDE
ncbi:hypothetical protein [Candidatus Jidaibacter acanthamoebae]|nr:hypothetical protein [Candidatus Jidaibacter acanthamoeba]